MDCEQVFKILTSGPFPTGEAWDEQVEAHLEMCAGLFGASPKRFGRRWKFFKKRCPLLKAETFPAIGAMLDPQLPFSASSRKRQPAPRWHPASANCSNLIAITRVSR